MKIFYFIIFTAIIVMGCTHQSIREEPKPAPEEPKKIVPSEEDLVQSAKNIAEAKRLLEKAAPLCKKVLDESGYAGYTVRHRELEKELVTVENDFASKMADILDKTIEVREACEKHVKACESGASQLEALLNFKKTLMELSETLGKTLTLCLEMENTHLIVENKRLSDTLEELGSIAPHKVSEELSKSPSPMWTVQSHRKDCEEEYTIFKVLPRKEYENWKKMHAAFCQFHTWPLPAYGIDGLKNFLLEDAKAFSMLLNHKEYPTSLPGCVSKRVKVVLDRLYQRYFNLRGLNTCTKQEIEGEWLLFRGRNEATEVLMDRLDPLVTEVLRQVLTEALLQR